MDNVPTVLRAIARRMTLRNALNAALVSAAVAAALWCLLALAFGSSLALFAVLIALTALGAGAAGLTARASVLDAARLVERIAGWQERLSTLVELEERREENPFRARLRTEVDELARGMSPSRFVSWDVLRPAAVAACLLAVAVAVTLVFPQGLAAALKRSETQARLERAAAILEPAAKSLEEAAVGAPSVNDLRMRVVGLLEDVRSGHPLGEIEKDADAAVEQANDLDPSKSRFAMRDVSDTLRGAELLRTFADALKQGDWDKLAGEAGKLAETLPAADPAERQGAIDALRSAAETSKIPGTAEPLKSAADALAMNDYAKFGQSLDRFVKETRRTVEDANRAKPVIDEIRDAIRRVQALVATGKEPGPKPRRGTAEFFVEGAKPAPDNATAGNLVVRGRPPDIRNIWENSRAAAGGLPDFTNIREDARGVVESPTLAPDYRNYLRRYFDTDNS